MKRRMKKNVRYALYGVGFIAVTGLIYGIEKTVFPLTFKDKDPYDYVSETILQDIIPVVDVDDTVIKPFSDTKVNVVKEYYDYKADSEEQKKSLIYNDNTYLQSTGISYSSGDIFDVVSILDGTVIDVKEDDLLGKVVEIRHSNDVISVYQSLGETNCKINDTVKQNDVIGKSGTSNISKELGNHLYFELIVDGTNVNPEEYYDKKVSDF